MSTNNEQLKRLSETLKKTRGKLAFFRVAAFFFLLTTVAALSTLVREDIVALPNFSSGKPAPYKQEVQKIIQDLRYSGLANFFKPDVSLAVDFEGKTWTMRNVHRFDNAGRIVLTEGRYGLCGDLSAYVLDRIRPLFGDKYDIRFLHVAESGYFLDPRASHVALSIREPSLFGWREYILDPSFKRYGPEDEFDDYQFFDNPRELPMLTARNPDEVFPADTHMPLIIAKGYLVSLTVSSFNGKFDRDNFILTLAVTKRFKYAGRYLFAIRRENGVMDVMENDRLAHLVLDKEDYRKLKEKIQEIYSRL